MALRHIGLLLWATFSAVLVVGQFYITIPLTPDIASRFGIAPASAALAGSVFGLAYATGLLLFGSLSDRYGRRPILLYGLITLALATVAASQASTFEFLLAARALQGLAAATFPPAALSLLAERLPAERQPLGVSLISFAFLGSAPLGQFAVAWLGIGLSEAMLSLTLLYLLSASGLLALIPRSSHAGRHAVQPASGHRAPLRQDLVILAAWAAAATVLFGFIAFHSGAQALYAETGVDLQLLRLVGLPPLLATFVAARLIARLGAATTAALGLAVAAAAFGIAQTHLPASLVLASITLSAGTALAVPGLIATVSGQATAYNRSLALAVYSFILFLGASAAPPLAQALVTAANPVLWLLVPGASLGLAAVLLLSAARWLPTAVPAGTNQTMSKQAAR